MRRVLLAATLAFSTQGLAIAQTDDQRLLDTRIARRVERKEWVKLPPGALTSSKIPDEYKRAELEFYYAADTERPVLYVRDPGKTLRAFTLKPNTFDPVEGEENGREIPTLDDEGKQPGFASRALKTAERIEERGEQAGKSASGFIKKGVKNAAEKAAEDADARIEAGVKLGRKAVELEQKRQELVEKYTLAGQAWGWTKKELKK